MNQENGSSTNGEPNRKGNKESDVSAEDIAKRNRGRPFAKTIHSLNQDSLLSVNAVGVDYRGFLNLVILVTVAANLRLVVENIMKYGPRVAPPVDFLDFYRNWPCSVCYFELVGLVIAAWAVERHIAPMVKSDIITNLIHAILIFLMIGVPLFTVRVSSTAPSASVLLMLFTIAWAMKMFSFAHTCYDIRRAIKRGVVEFVTQDDEASRRVIQEEGFPQCLHLRGILQFLAFPTLLFQLHYPRLPYVRKSILTRHLVSLVFCFFFAYVLIEQYITPLLENARQYVQMDERPDGTKRIVRVSWGGLFERLLKLSIPNLYLWLLIFYALFHCWLNVLGELTRFGDRRFYTDWWNAASFAEYWKRWNLPVHNWMLRHLYFPLLRRGWNRTSAGCCVFLFSGLMHELLVVVPLRMSRPTVLVTLAFLGQLPLTMLTARPWLENKHRTIGNGIFWLAFCFSGQPMAILIYFLLAVDPELETMGSVLSLR